MFVAVNKNNERVYIEECEKDEDCYCPICGEKLIKKQGDIVRHHFAHPKGSICSDSWHYDMTPWHYNWQEKFPKECREVVKNYKGKKHRADILIESNKVVIEFQHSEISVEEFDDRNEFYNNLGYKVIWLFDLHEYYGDTLIEYEKYDNCFIWKYAKKLFNYVDLDDHQKVEIYFQLRIDAKDDELLQYYYNEIKRMGVDDLGPDVDDYIYEHEDDSVLIYKLRKISNAGIKYFYVYDNAYSENDFIHIVQKKKQECDTIYNIWAKYNMKSAILINSIDKYYVKILQNPILQMERYNSIKGYVSNYFDSTYFKGDFIKIEKANEKCWKLVKILEF